MLRLLTHLFDSRDPTVEVPDLLVALSFLAVVGFQGWALWRGQPFSVGEFGGAIGIILTGGGIGSAGTRFLRHGFRTPATPIPGANVRPDNPEEG